MLNSKAKRWAAALLLVILALSASALWLLSSTSGLRWAAAQVSSIVALEGVDGSLLGPLSAKSLVIDSKDLRITAQDVQLDWRPAALLGGKLEITALAARDVEVLSLPSPAPQSLLLPLPMALTELKIANLRVLGAAGGTPFFSAKDITAKLDSDGRLHHLQELRASLDYGKLNASGQMDGVAPFAVQAQGDLAGLAEYTGTAAQEAHISASLSGNLTQLDIKAQGSGAGLSGIADAQLAIYAAYPLAALHVQAHGLNPRAFSPKAPKAELALQAELHGNAQGVLEGDVNMHNATPAPIDHDGLPLLDARAHATLAADSLQFDHLALAFAQGGSVAGNFAWQRKQMTGAADLSISRLDPSTMDTRARSFKLDGSIKLSGDRNVQQGVLALSDGTLHVDARLSRTGDAIALDTLRLTRDQAALSGAGKLRLDGNRPYSFNGKLENFDLAAFVRAPHSALNATLDLSGELAPQTIGTLNFAMANSRLDGHAISGNGQIEFAGTDHAKGEAELQLGDNRLSASGGFGAATDQLQLDLAAPALAQLGAGFGGTLNAHATLSGSLNAPEVALKLAGHELILPGDHHLDSLSADAGLHGEALELNASAAGYRIGEAHILNAQLGVHGSRAQHEVKLDTQLDNANKLMLRANGGLSDPAQGWGNIQWQGRLSELSGAGMLPFKLQAAASLNLGQDHVNLSAAELAVAGGRVHIDHAAWTPQHWSSRGNFSAIGLRAGIGLQPEFIAADGLQALRLGGEWDIASAAQLSGNLRVARESGDWILPGDTPLPMGLQALQLTAHAADGQLSGNLTALGARLGSWHANVAMPLTQSGTGWMVSAQTPLNGQMQVNIPDLSWIGPALNDSWKSAGQFTLLADVAGTIGTPRLLGQVRGDDLALALLDQGIQLQQGQLAARFDQNSVYLDTLNFIAPKAPQPRDRLLIGLNLPQEPGKLSASGTMDLTGESGNLEINASLLPLAQRPDRWIVASGKGSAKLNKNILTLGGNIKADAGLINQPVTDRPQLSDDIVVTGQPQSVRRGPRVVVDATLDLGEHFFLRASGLEARLAGQLNVRDAGQQLRVIGSIAASDASFEAYGQRLTVDRGLVNFQGPLSDPGLNILALRKGLSVEAGVEVTGTAQHPVVRLVSTPAVPDSEKLSWIVLGRLPATSGMDSSMLLTAAGSILGGRSGGITGQLKQALGVDELSLRQSDTTGQTATDKTLSNQIITVGKRLSARAFLSYEQGVTAAAGVTKLSYTLTPRINVVTQAGIENAIDVFYTFGFE